MHSVEVDNESSCEFQYDDEEENLSNVVPATMYHVDAHVPIADYSISNCANAVMHDLFIKCECNSFHNHNSDSIHEYLEPCNKCHENVDQRSMPFGDSQYYKPINLRILGSQ